MLNGESIMRLSREFDVARAVLYRWRDTCRAEGLTGLARRGGRPELGQEAVRLTSQDPAAERIADLERLIGRQAAELDLFERAFDALKLAKPNSAARSESTPVRAPLANSICERLIGTIRRECLDFIIPLGERHLKRILREWIRHYNRGRPHKQPGSRGTGCGFSSCTAGPQSSSCSH